ncbi:MAG TPA: hypothetical protein VJA21_32790 [Verrucomicrobiae bacterium]
MRSAAVSGSSKGGCLFVAGRGLVPLCLLGFGLLAASAQVPAPGPDQARWSHSGQFIINIAPARRAPPRLVSNLETNREFMRLDPTLVPVSCERIKQRLSRVLGLGSSWTGRIFLSFFPAGSDDDPVTITSGRFRDGWQYGVELPDVVHRLRYVRAIVHVLLLETANRNAIGHSAEIPAWLSEGLAHDLLLSSEMEIILPPPVSSGSSFGIATRVVNARKENPWEVVHKQLRASPPVTFQQLSWPAEDQLEGEAGAAYRNSACLFVNELLRLSDGPACLRTMLARLPKHYNWQFAFLEAFRGHFQRPLEVEKWWSLHLEHFISRELAQTWPAEESWRQLDDLLRSAVQVRAGTNELPLRAEMKLQTIVREWDRPHQDQALLQKLRELQMLRVRLAPEVALVCDEYGRILADYLHTRDRGGFPFRKQAARRQAVEQTVRRLDELDSRRVAPQPHRDTKPIQANSGPL